MKMTRRTQTHITDTLAIREILSKVPENWLIRGLEERDYGIDLHIEKFDGENPTGGFSLIQVKGTKNSFSGEVALNGFPTKTLEYAELFPEPFFIFHTSITDKKTYFVWAQKYIETKLSLDNPGWKSQDSNTIYFPDNNILGTDESNAKMEQIMAILAAQKSGLNYLADLETLKLHWSGYKSGQPDVINTCIEVTRNLMTHSPFYKLYDQYFFDVRKYEILDLLEELDINPIPDLDYKTEDDCIRLSRVDMLLEKFNAVKSSFLNQKGVDILQVEMTDDMPY